MDSYKKKFEVRWADLDPNFHVLHSRYYDYGAFCRMSFMVEHGLTPALMMKHHIGPILFKEECVFKKEIRFGDDMSINLEALDSKRDFSRWSLHHHIINGDGKECAQITVSGAWMDLHQRKLITPPEEFSHVFDAIPKAATFHYLGE